MLRLNQALRLARELSGKTQGQVALEMGFTRAYINAIESGKRRIHTDFLEDFGEAVGVPAHELAILAHVMVHPSLSGPHMEYFKLSPKVTELVRLHAAQVEQQRVIAGQARRS